MTTNKEYYHKSLIGGRWFSMSLAEQLANVGSEFERVLSWRVKGNREHADKAFERMLELLDLTRNDPRWRNHRLKELSRLREVINYELSAEDNENLFIAVQDLQKYFLQFGILARADR